MERLTHRCGKYINYKQMDVDAVIRKLADYEDKEEQGLLIELPCKVGKTVYLTVHDRLVMKQKPLMCIVDEFTMSDADCYAVLNANDPFYALHRFKAVNIKDFGKTVFLTEAEAEEALAKMGE